MSYAEATNKRIFHAWLKVLHHWKPGILIFREMDVKIEHRKDEIEFVRLALNIADVGIDYKTTDLVLRVIRKVNSLKGKFSLKDGVVLRHEWINEWNKYDIANSENTQAEPIPEKRITLAEFISASPMTVRLRNVLKCNEDHLPKFIEEISLTELGKLRNCSKKTVEEFKILREFYINH